MLLYGSLSLFTRSFTETSILHIYRTRKHALEGSTSPSQNRGRSQTTFFCPRSQRVHPFPTIPATIDSAYMSASEPVDKSVVSAYILVVLLVLGVCVGLAILAKLYVQAYRRDRAAAKGKQAVRDEEATTGIELAVLPVVQAKPAPARPVRPVTPVLAGPSRQYAPVRRPVSPVVAGPSRVGVARAYNPKYSPWSNFEEPSD
ncbi:hypothetical protein BT63DRAFT_116039 [Microthyrium microscopicum]|uniref:Transmembrane protein n=1 Tax=Microthyrium microscopicum TaxID=703497 RepID=A0A6A6TWW9_9PEZI|nr:hypothetical protein BT63DRAFT_116039 [Microthyrium microscopicum]